MLMPFAGIYEAIQDQYRSERLDGIPPFAPVPPEVCHLACTTSIGFVEQAATQQLVIEQRVNLAVRGIP